MTWPSVLTRLFVLPAATPISRDQRARSGSSCPFYSWRSEIQKDGRPSALEMSLEGNGLKSPGH